MNESLDNDNKYQFIKNKELNFIAKFIQLLDKFNLKK